MPAIMTVPQRIFWTNIGTSIVTIATFVVSLMWIATEVDDLAEAETSQRVSSTLSHLTQRNALLTADYAHWTSAYNWFVAGDTALLYNNIGSGASDSDTFDLIYLMTPQGTASYAYVSGVPGSDLRNFEPALANQAFRDLQALPIENYPTVSGIVAIDGEFALITAARIQPDDFSDLSVSDLPVMIGGVWLDPLTLEQIMMLDGLALHETQTDQTPNRSIVPMDGLNNLPVGYVSWPALKPSHALMFETAPIIALLTVLLLAGSAIVGRTSAMQATALLKEKEAARTDPITGLLNRKGIAEVTQKPKVAQAIKAGRTAVLYVDLNGLKMLNDTYGHRVGDEAIRVTAERLRNAARKQDFVARMGGDEFACLIIDDAPLTAADRMKDRFERMSAVQITIADRTFQATAATGVAMSGLNTDWEAMLHDADEAMYANKLAQKRGQSPDFMTLPAAS